MTKIYNDYDQKILDLALEGLSYRKIADTLYFTKEGTIRDLINSLNNPLHENYNPDLYARILMEKSLHSNILVDKDLIDNVVRMILDGYLSIEIAVLNNLNKDDYRRILSIIKDGTYYSEDFISKIKEKLRKTNRMNVNEKYKRIWRLEREYSFNAFEDYGIKLTAYKHWKSCFQLVEDFLYNGLDLSTLHLKYGFDRTTIKAILVGTDCSQFMANNFDAETCQKAKDKYFSIANASRENPYEAKVVDKFDDIKINKIINNKCFWILFMLTLKLIILLVK